MLRILLLITMCRISKFTVDAQCDGTPQDVLIGHSPVTISPPGYPNGYDINMLCAWIARPIEDGYQLLFMIINIKLPCTDDTISVYDGIDKTGVQLVTDKCTPEGSTSSKIAYKTTTSGSLYIEFQSDNIATATEKGFEVKIISATDSSGTACSSTVNLQASASKQYISSPNFPQMYSLSKTCRWIISTYGGQRIILNTEMMDIEEGNNCPYDYLKITDGNTGNSQTFCKEQVWTPFRYTSNTTTLTLDFKSDGAQKKQGFLLSYKHEYNGCTRCSEIMISKSSYLLFIIVFVYIQITYY